MFIKEWLVAFLMITVVFFVVVYNISTKNKNPYVLMIISGLLAVYGAFVGLGILEYGNESNQPYVSLLGNVFVVFISVITGGLISSAISEIRSKNITRN